LFEIYQKHFLFYQRVLAQQPKDKNKIYSLHEPDYCLFDRFVSVSMTYGNISVFKLLLTNCSRSSTFFCPYSGNRTLLPIIPNYFNLYLQCRMIKMVAESGLKIFKTC
jgi:hypothetical protein